MCQLCTITTLARSSRWPKPMESSVSDITFAVSCAHDQYTAWQKSLSTSSTASTNASTVTPPQALLDTTTLLAEAISALHEERQAWWKSKAALLKKLTEDFETEKLTGLHKINNSAVERIGGMEAKVGVFVRWGLGVEGGVEALGEGV